MLAAKPVCPHLSACPGCPRFGNFGVPTAAEAALRAFVAEYAVPHFELVSATNATYRARSRLAVRGRAGRAKIGLFELGTHQVVDVPQCAVHHPAINAAANSIKRALADTRVPLYSDAAHAGLVRYLQLVVERATGRVQVVVVANCEEPSVLSPLFERIQVGLGERLQGLFFNGQTERTNTILGPFWHHVSGEEAVVDEVGGARVFFPPGAFGQANPDGFDAIVARVHGWVPDAQRVTELYAGVGAIGLGLVRRSAHVLFNERSPDAIAGLRQGIAALGVDPSRVQVEPGPAEEIVDSFDPEGCVIVDPPRRGLDPRVLERIAARRVRRVIYVSCGLDSFLRDAAQLARTHRCVEVAGYALFPFTDHVETVACFDLATQAPSPG